MNKVILMGRLTKDAEIRFTNENQRKVATFTLAVNRKVKDEADFINCVAWNKTADLFELYVKKGTQIIVEGRLQTRNYEKDGHKVYVTEVIVENVYFTGSKDNKQEQIEEQTDNNQFEIEEEQVDFFAGDESDELPF